MRPELPAGSRRHSDVACTIYSVPRKTTPATVSSASPRLRSGGRQQAEQSPCAFVGRTPSYSAPVPPSGSRGLASAYGCSGFDGLGLPRLPYPEHDVRLRSAHGSRRRLPRRVQRCAPPSLRGGGWCRPGPRRVGPRTGRATWLILPVVICLSQRLSHACASMN